MSAESTPGARRAHSFALLGAMIATTMSAHVAADVVHRVQPGDTLASISQRYYGTVTREAVLVAANVLHAQTDASILPGMHIVVPAVSFYRVQQGDTWVRVAQQELGSATHAAYLAQINRGDFAVSPSAGAVLRIPYLLRYVVMDEEPLFEIARRFYGDRAQVQFILNFNHTSSSRLARGQHIVLPIADLLLRAEPVCENSAPLAAAANVQQRVDRDLPLLASLVAHGQYEEAVSLGARLAGAEGLSVAQRLALHRAMAEAYCALDRPDLAAESFRDALRADPTLQLDTRLTSPKMLEAFAIARGVGTARAVDPAPATARPDEAH